MTALHWAALNGDAELAQMLLYAGANVGAKTRIGGYTPLHLAAQVGNANVIAPLVAAGAQVAALTATGATALMQAAHSGSADAVRILIENGADPNVKETANGQTALMFAAAADRIDVVKLLLARGADLHVTSRVEDFAALTMTNDADQNGVPRPQPPTQPGTDVPGITRPFNYNELIGKHGGLAALHFAARQGAMATAEALIKAGANVNQRGAGDKTTPILVAAINGHFDLVSYLLDNGADPNLASDGGVTPLYAVINVQWQPRSFYPQPRAYLQQKTGYLDLMKKLLDKGADPNARTNRNTWFTQYNFDLLRTDDSGATPFWRAAYASDIAAMKMLIEHGGDPNIPTMKVAQRGNFQGGTRGGSDRDPLGRVRRCRPAGPARRRWSPTAGAGYSEGFAGNAHRFAPTGMMAAVKYLVEEVGVDVNAEDEDGSTAVHNAASRGDNEMILYLVSKGADVKKVNRRGQTTVDMANGPVQRTQPYPETIKLL